MLRTASPILALVFFVRSGLAAEGAAPSGELTFEKHVRPILKAQCFACHGEGEKLKGKLDLRLRRLIEQGGASGPSLITGQRDKSLLFEKIAKEEMPPGKKKLTKDEVALIGRWIAEGAKTARLEPAAMPPGIQFTQEEKEFWAFQPIQRPDLPRVQQTNRVRTPIDAFLLAKLEEKKLAFAPEADKQTLIRRATFDLLGLPPTPEEVARFLADSAPDAYERLIDRLLASPHYGEHWGRHWLDVAGYADSEGYSTDDTVRPHAYKYRDYVIRSFNAGKPFDQFIREQLAGDELVKQPYENLGPDDIEKLTATGFLRMAPDGTASSVDQNVARNQVMADSLKIVSTSLLGLSVGCAQCHNHRYDPIPQTDYYRLRAIFEPAYDWKNWKPPAARRISLYTDADRQQAAQIEVKAVEIDAARLKKQAEFIENTFDKELAKLPEKLREPIRVARKTEATKQTPEQKQLLKDYPSVNVTDGSLYLYDPKAAAELKKLADEAAKMRATKPVEDFIRALTEVPGEIPLTFLFQRGDHAKPKQVLSPGDLTILAAHNPTPIPDKNPTLPTSGRRLAFAARLTDRKHPLPARTLVNRVWLHHFGKGIVGTPGDLGFLGERPTHPQLLDWLASEFTASGWELKRLHKLLMTSTAYRQVARREPTKDTLDPDNRLLGRWTVRRLEAETIRDSILSLSGQLNCKMFGPPIPVMEDEVGQFVIGIENKNGENRPGPILPMHGEDFRRSVYVQVRRSRPLSMIDTFDAATVDPNCEARASSTVTPQSLLFMNSEFVVSQAEFLAGRVRQGAGPDAVQQVTYAWRLAFGLDPTDGEIKDAVAFLSEQTATLQQLPTAKPGVCAKPVDPKLRALASLCQALVSGNGFLYVD